MMLFFKLQFTESSFCQLVVGKEDKASWQEGSCLGCVIFSFFGVASLLLLLFNREIQRKKWRKYYTSSRWERDTSSEEEKLGFAAEIWLVNSFLGLSACNDPFAPSRRILNSWILSSYIYCTFLKWENYFLTDTRIWQTENSSSPDSSPRTNDEL